MSLVPRKPVAPISQSARRPSGGGMNSSSTTRLPLTSRSGARDAPGGLSREPSDAMGGAMGGSSASDVVGATTTASSSNLSPFEVDESRAWREPIYYAGANCPNKIPAPVNGGVNFGFDDERGD